jgi:hypothetical protein
LIAGEEPELGLRLRKAGYRIRRLDREMTLHDANMTRFAQWWSRQVRAGHACAESVALHGSEPERFFVRRLVSNFAWGLGLPLLCLAGLAISPLAPLAGLGVYAAFVARIAAHPDAASERGAYAVGILLGKFAGVRGALLYVGNALRRRHTGLIEPRGAAG